MVSFGMGAEFDPSGSSYAPPPGEFQRRRAIRASDADREAAAAALHEHFASGRLDTDELGERLSAAYAATTQGQLDRLFVDLPSPVGSHPRVAGPGPIRGGPPCRRRTTVWMCILPLAIFGGLLSDHRHSLGGEIGVLFLAAFILCCVLCAVVARRVRASVVYQALHQAGRHWSEHRSRW